MFPIDEDMAPGANAGEDSQLDRLLDARMMEDPAYEQGLVAAATTEDAARELQLEITSGLDLLLNSGKITPQEKIPFKKI